MNITKIFKYKIPSEISKKIQSYLAKEEVNKIENIRLVCSKCGKEYVENFAYKNNQDLCPCYISWLYFNRDFENPWI